MKNLMAVFILVTLIAACRDGGGEKKGAASPVPVPPPASVAFPGTTPADEVKNAVLRYNELLAFGYRNLTMSPLVEVTNPRQAEKAYYHMAAIGEGGVRMESVLKKAEFLSVSFPAPEESVVKTREIWDFSYIDLKTSAVHERERDFVYLMTYTLRKENGRWLIIDTAAAGEGADTKGIEQRGRK